MPFGELPALPQVVTQQGRLGGGAAGEVLLAPRSPGARPSATRAPDRLRAAVAAVLTDPAYRDNAARVQADFARHNSAAEAARLLERLAESKTQVEEDPADR
jgi:hypothetical protein